MRGCALTTIHPPLHDGPNAPILTRLMGRVASLLLGAAGCAVFSACGGATDTNLFDDAGQQNDATAQDTGTGTDGGNPEKDVTVQDQVVVDAIFVDVPVKPADSKIHCGTTTCSAQTQVCCASFGTTTTTYACVSSTSDCQGTNQVPISCTSGDNCASQGNSGDICCASGQGFINPNPTCQGYDTVAQVMCQSTCDINQGEFEVGCSTQAQNCTDTAQTCITSKCTLPGITICQ